MQYFLRKRLLKRIYPNPYHEDSGYYFVGIVGIDGIFINMVSVAYFFLFHL